MQSESSQTTTAFTDQQFANPYPDGIQYYFWHVARNRIIEQQLRSCLQPGGPDLILDIGCGRGIAVECLRNKGWNAIGCDLGKPEPISATVAPYLTLDADAFQLPVSIRSAVKCITMLDVLEHLEEPRQFLAQCLDAFPALRFVLVTLPARNEIWSRWDDYYGHFTRYTIATAKALFDRSEFQVLRSGYFFHVLYVPALMMRGVKAKRDVVVKPPKSRALHAAVGSLMYFEHRVLPARLPGSSVYALVRVHH